MLIKYIIYKKCVRSLPFSLLYLEIRVPANILIADWISWP